VPLLKTISGIRGTIGGMPGENLSPQDIVECTAAFGTWLLQNGNVPKIVVGRDGRISGPMVSQLAAQTLIALGFEVIDLGWSTTPTVEMAVPKHQAGGGIIFTASHNPAAWNALKLLNKDGEFISAEDGQAFLALLEQSKITYADVFSLGKYKTDTDALDFHLNRIMQLPEVLPQLVQSQKFRIVVDAVNSTGALAVPALLQQLGCEVILLNGEIHGHFAHNPEPLPEHLSDLRHAVLEHHADLGIAVDPDVDRLALVCEDGSFFGEEYTLVAIADYILSSNPGNTVSNLSSSRALRDVTVKHGGQYFAAAVGEVNVVHLMKSVNAVIGGEGNGGIIVPQLHYGRDALAGIALFLSQLALDGRTVSALRKDYPEYYMVKDRITLSTETDMEGLLQGLYTRFRHEQCNRQDGLKIDFETGWVHLRRSNTEPIIRIYAEAGSPEKALELVKMMKNAIS
jgi:phosphomannomutase